MIKTFKKGSIIVRQGDNINKNLYIVKSGKCAIKRAVNNVVIDCGNLHPGDLFGEMSMILGLERSATILATDETVEVEELNKASFFEAIKKDPEIAWKVLTNLALKTQMLDEIQNEISDPELLKAILVGKKQMGL